MGSCCLWPWCWDPAPWNKPRSPSEGPCSLSWVQVAEVSRGGRGPEGLETIPVLLLITAINFVNHSSSFPIIPLYSNFFDLYSTLGVGKNHHSRTERNKLSQGHSTTKQQAWDSATGCLIPVFCHITTPASFYWPQKFRGQKCQTEEHEVLSSTSFQIKRSRRK